MRFAFVLLLCVSLSACPKDPGHPAADATATASAQKHYVVTISPLAMIVGELARGRAEVSVLLPCGAESEDYEPSPADAKKVASADLFMYVAPNLEGWASKLEAKRKLEVISILPPGAQRRFSGLDRGDKNEQPGLTDPHFWTSPATVDALLAPLADRLSAVDPQGDALYRANALGFHQQLVQLDAWASKQLAPVKGKAVLMFHPSFGYLLDRYGIVDGGTVEPVAGAEPSANYLARLVRTAKARGAACVFTEPLLPRKPADVLGAEAHLPVVSVDPACGNPQRAYNDYAEWFRYNVQQIAQALK